MYNKLHFFQTTYNMLTQRTQKLPFRIQAKNNNAC